MSRSSVRSLGIVVLLAMTSSIPAQTPPRPGMVLVDDMWLPAGVVYGDSFFNACPWPNGDVPYVFTSGIPFAQRQAFIRATEEIEAICDVDFRPRSGEADYVRVEPLTTNANAGSSCVGMIGGMQPIQLGANFMNVFAIAHELMHCLGFLHEQSRPDRDQYVTINWGNVSQNACGGSCDGNFQIVNGGTTYGPYDFLSLMHYGQYFFSICQDPAGPTCAPGLETITCKPAYSQWQNVIGQQSFVSNLDAFGLTSRYGASTRVPEITGVGPGAISQGSGTTTVDVYGTGFYLGSTMSQGVVGTEIKVNGALLPLGAVQFVTSTHLRVDIPSIYFVSAGCLEIRAHHTYGGTGNPWFIGVNSNIPTVGFVAGGGSNAYMGSSVAGIGDVNNDHYDDFVSGAPGVQLGAFIDSGRVTCISGKDGAVLWSRGAGWYQQLGVSMANADDVDGDGVDDVIVGAPGSLGTSNATWGAAYVLSGVDGSQIRAISDFAVDDGLGTSVDNAGDVNGDGVPDQVIGVPGIDRARIYSGATGAVLRTFVGFPGSFHGGSVAGGYDFTGDGVPDQVVGAPLYVNSRGRVRFYSGFTGVVVQQKTGSATGDQLGLSVAMMPAPDGGSGGAVVIGAPRVGTNNVGEVRVYGAVPAPGSYPPLATFSGPAAWHYFGWSVADAGDLNQDGRHEIAIGVPRHNTTPGYVEIIDGRTMTPLERADGYLTGDRFGWAVAKAGDTNADGVPDLVVGARFAEFGCTDEGYATTVHRIVPPSQQKLMITEVHWGTRAGIEIVNFGTAPQDISGMTVLWNDGTEHVSSAAPSLVLGPGEPAILFEPSGIVMCASSGCTATDYFGEAPPNTAYAAILPSISTGSQPFQVALRDPIGIVIDEVRVQGTGLAAPSYPSAGGYFRGAAPRDPSTVSVERIWGLDSNSGGDWTKETVRSFGLENRSSGLRGTDPIPVPHVVINEMDDDPDYIEIKNVAGYTVDLRNWFLRASAWQNGAHSLHYPWPMTSSVVIDNGFIVIGDVGVAPPEKPAWVPYVNLVSVASGLAGASTNIPWFSDEYDCALYDAYGRLADLVRTTGHDDVRVHNHPRSPSAPLAFTGAAGRNQYGDAAVGRKLLNIDTDSGADWVPIYTRSMGSPNSLSSYGGLPGLAGGVDVRLNGTPYGGGVTCIINAGPVHAGDPWTLLLSFGHHHGQGAFFGLGSDALGNWLTFSSLPPWSGNLDANGSARIDIRTGVLLPGLVSDDIFIVRDGAGGISARTAVIEWDM